MSDIKDILASKTDELFKIYDANKTGKLDFGEFKHAITKIFQEQGKPAPSFFDFSDILKKYDKDGDRMIDKDEFKTMLFELTGQK